uniref:Uncharacterized protein n=1 Tax=Trichobilharzia regenti TaxID=157069 RepID=A0AA85J426_TRIRE|nr:unnamed protein product [Trichobilharzia regenti]
MREEKNTDHNNPRDDAHDMHIRRRRHSQSLDHNTIMLIDQLNWNENTLRGKFDHLTQCECGITFGGHAHNDQCIKADEVIHRVNSF